MRFSAALLACLVAAVCAAAPRPALGALDRGDGRPAPVRPDPLEGWRISVSVAPTRVGSLAVSVGPIRPASVRGVNAWVEHELVLENRSNRRLQFADTRISAFLPPQHPALIAGDQGCGYATWAGSGLELGCTLDLDAFAIEAGASLSRTITLFKDIRGLNRLEPGTYVFRKPIRFQPGREIPQVGAGLTRVLRIGYQIETVR